MNFNLMIDTLSKWTKSQRNSLYLVGYIFIIAVYSGLFLWPSLSSITESQSTLNSKQSDLNDVKELNEFN